MNRHTTLPTFYLASSLAFCLVFCAPTLAAEQPKVRLQTSLGTIVLELNPEKAPMTVANFLMLVEDGFYDGLTFHRVVAGYVIQGGGFDADMTQREPPKNVPNESMNGLSNRKGSISMARRSDPDSAGSQFFINVKNNTHLDGKRGRPGYAVFGQVVNGMKTVTAIELVDTDINNGMAAVPVEPVIILNAAVCDSDC